MPPPYIPVVLRLHLGCGRVQMAGQVGFRSIATSVLMLERLDCGPTIRIISIWHYLMVGNISQLTVGFPLQVSWGIWHQQLGELLLDHNLCRAGWVANDNSFRCPPCL